MFRSLARKRTARNDENNALKMWPLATFLRGHEGAVKRAPSEWLCSSVKRYLAGLGALRHGGVIGPGQTLLCVCVCAWEKLRGQ